MRANTPGCLSGSFLLLASSANRLLLVVCCQHVHDCVQYASIRLVNSADCLLTVYRPAMLLLIDMSVAADMT